METWQLGSSVFHQRSLGKSGSPGRLHPFPRADLAPLEMEPSKSPPLELKTIRLPSRGQDRSMVAINGSYDWEVNRILMELMEQAPSIGHRYSKDCVGFSTT